MSKDQFTPAPWHAEFDADESCWQVVYSPLDDVMAIVLSDLDTSVPEHDGEANAHRIAAAINACEGISTQALEAGVIADLLEACESFLAYDAQDDHSELGMMLAYGEAREKIIAAVAKAKGEVNK